MLQKSASPTALAWHPNRKFLAIGWDNGEVDIFNDQDKEVYSVPQLHTAAITTLNWTGSGSRLGTGDKVSFNFLFASFSWPGDSKKILDNIWLTNTCRTTIVFNFFSLKY